MILEDIVESTKERVETNKKRHSIYELKEKAFAMPIDQSFPFKKALEKDGMSYILEVKRHSPSKGQIVSTFDFKAIAKEYEMIGADAISVVTEPDYFKGDDDFLREIKRIVKIPVLRKDFVVDEYMVYEAKILGADAILLIAGVLDEITLMRCVNLAHNLGMSAIVETHSSMQVKKALRVGAKIIGVNNRDLRDFSVDLNTTLKLRDMVDDDVIFVSESGIKTREDIELLERVPEDKLAYVVQILSSIDGLISISDRRTKKIDLDQFVMPTTERGRNADEYIREMRDNDRL